MKAPPRPEGGRWCGLTSLQRNCWRAGCIATLEFVSVSSFSLGSPCLSTQPALPCFIIQKGLTSRSEKLISMARGLRGPHRAVLSTLAQDKICCGLEGPQVKNLLLGDLFKTFSPKVEIKK